MLDNTARHDLRIRGSAVRPVNKFNLTTSHAYFVIGFINISLPLLHNHDVKMHNFTFYWGRKQTKTNFFPRWICLHLKKWATCNNPEKVWKNASGRFIKKRRFDRCRRRGTLNWPTSKPSVAFWWRGGKRKESLQLRLWNLNICIEKVDAKCWLAEMTLVKTSLPLARLFQLFNYYSRVRFRWALIGGNLYTTRNDPRPQMIPQFFHTLPEMISEEL